MKHKDPVNIYNGLKFKHESSKPKEQSIPSHLVAMKAYKNASNLSKPFVKPITKIF